MDVDQIDWHTSQNANELHYHMQISLVSEFHFDIRGTP